MNGPSSPYSYGVNSTITVLLQEWLWQKMTHAGWYAIKKETKLTVGLVKRFYLIHNWDNFGSNGNTVYFIFPKAPQQEPHHQLQLIVIHKLQLSHTTIILFLEFFDWIMKCQKLLFLRCWKKKNSTFIFKNFRISKSNRFRFS